MTPYPGIPEEALERYGALPDELRVLLREAVEPLVEQPEAPVRVLEAYGRLLLAANTLTNLSGAREWEPLVRSHLVDCLQAVRFLPPEVDEVVDWGAGGGLPGIPWAIALPRLRVGLLERSAKKAGFLEDAVARLGLESVEVLHGAGEELARMAASDPAPLLRRRPQCVVARAVEPLDRLLGRLKRARIVPRLLFLMAGPGFEADWRALPPALRNAWRIRARHSYSLELGQGQEARSRAALLLRPARSGDR